MFRLYRVKHLQSYLCCQYIIADKPLFIVPGVPVLLNFIRFPYTNVANSTFPFTRVFVLPFARFPISSITTATLYINTFDNLQTMRILIIRHADPDYANDSVTEEGKLEADALARRLASGNDGKITHLYTSPRGRARVTAAPSEAALGLTAKVEEWTRELTYWPTLPPTDLPNDSVLAMWDMPAGQVRSIDSLTKSAQWSLIPDIESARGLYENLQVDSDAFIARHGYVREGHQYRIARPNRDVIAVFCHAGFGLSWLAHLLNIPLAMAWTSFYLAPSSVTTILFDERSPDFACPRAIGVSDVGHLYKDNLAIPDSMYEQPNVFGNWKRPSGIKANFW